MEAFVYVLESLTSKRYYIGSTDNLIRRYWQHAAGCCHTTRRMLPVRMAAWMPYPSLGEARQAERELKKKNSRRYVDEFVEQANGVSC